MASVRKPYIQKSIKRIETIICRKILKYILALDKEFTNIVLVTLEHFKFNFWICQLLCYMKLGLNVGTFCQIQLQVTLGVRDMLEDNLCSD